MSNLATRRWEENESQARKAADGLRVEINKEVPNSFINSITFGRLAAHYQDRELPDDISQAKVTKAHSTAVTYRRYLRKWIKPRWESYLLHDIHSVAAQDWLYQLNVSNGTKAKIRNIMSAVFRHAIRYGSLPRSEEFNPIKYVGQSAASDVFPTIVCRQNFVRQEIQGISTAAGMDAYAISPDP